MRFDLAPSRRRINRQRNVLAESRLQPLDRAILIAAARAAADSDRADHLPVDNDWNAARVCEQVEIGSRPRNPARIVLELRRIDGSGLPRSQRSLRLSIAVRMLLKTWPSMRSMWTNSPALSRM